MPITDWPPGERPRERLILQGAGVLSDAELLAILLRTGTAGRSAIDLARDMLSHFVSLGGLLHAPVNELLEQPGLGPAKLAQLAAAAEIGRRCLAERVSQANALSHPDAVRDYLRLSYGFSVRETFVAVYLSAQNRVLAVEELSRGTLTEVRVYTRELIKSALQHNAASVILAHNHPSGETEPSRADRDLTVTLSKALSLVDIRLVDHLVITTTCCTSFAERGWL